MAGSFDRYSLIPAAGASNSAAKAPDSLVRSVFTGSSKNSSLSEASIRPSDGACAKRIAVVSLLPLGRTSTTSLFDLICASPSIPAALPAYVALDTRSSILRYSVGLSPRALRTSRAAEYPRSHGLLPRVASEESRRLFQFLTGIFLLFLAKLLTRAR